MTTNASTTPTSVAPAGHRSEPLGPAATGSSVTESEIAQQPRLWRQVVAVAADRREETRAFLRPILQRPDLRIVLTGAGTSAFAGQVLAPALARELHRRVDAVATTDIVCSPREVFAEDVPTLLVSFARSGDSPESLAATALAEQCLSEVRHLIVTCNSAGKLYQDHSGAERSLVLLMPEASNDQGFAMTSSFTCMLLATWLTLRPGAPDAALVERLAVAAERILGDRAEDVGAVAARGYRRLVYLGSGSLSGLARESALKMLELTAGDVVTYFDSPLGFRHGPKSVLDERTLAVVYLSNDPYTRQYDEDIATELLGALSPQDVVLLGARPSERLHAAGLWQVEGLDDAADAELCLPFVVVAQVLALEFSLRLGRAPDNPFPSGEVNRVVKGVTVYRLGDGE
jgi:tagatose-6-phosphate ketose/aldose isomerase